MKIPMTAKRKAAIKRYVALKAEGNMTLDNVIDLTLKAERMWNQELHNFLERRGWRWRPRLGRWIQ